MVAFSIHKLDSSFLDLRSQLLHELLQMPELHRFPNMKMNSCFLQHLRQFCLDSLIQLGHLFDLGFLPYETVLVGIGFYLCSVNEDCLQINQTGLYEHPDQLDSQFQARAFQQYVGPEPTDRIVIRCFPAF